MMRRVSILVNIFVVCFESTGDSRENIHDICRSLISWRTFNNFLLPFGPEKSEWSDGAQIIKKNVAVMMMLSLHLLAFFHSFLRFPHPPDTLRLFLSSSRWLFSTSTGGESVTHNSTRGRWTESKKSRFLLHSSVFFSSFSLSCLR